jgi:hypothetical protein
MSTAHERRIFPVSEAERRYVERAGTLVDRPFSSAIDRGATAAAGRRPNLRHAFA